MMYKPYETTFRNQTLTIREKLANLSFSYLLLIIMLASIGIIMLYSVTLGVKSVSAFCCWFCFDVIFGFDRHPFVDAFCLCFLFRNAFVVDCGRNYRAYRDGGSALD